MSTKTRREKEVRRLVDLGRAASGIRRVRDSESDEYSIIGTIRRSGAEFFVVVELDRFNSERGDEVVREERYFPELEAALTYYVEKTGIPIWQLEV
jgi:hypothetical protein